MKDSTPAHQIRATDEAANERAQRRLLAKAPDVSTVVELFGGLGRVTVVLRERFPNAQLLVTDADAQCCALIRSVAPSADVRCEDAFARAKDWPAGAGIVADFNLLTLQRAFEGNMRDEVEAIFAARPTFAILADSAIGKLHLNGRAYGLPKRTTLEAYTEEWRKRALAQWGYELIAYDRAHARTVFLLFQSPDQEKTR